MKGEHEMTAGTGSYTETHVPPPPDGSSGVTFSANRGRTTSSEDRGRGMAERLEFVGHEPPQITIGLTDQLNKGIAAQLRALADLLDSPHMQERER